MGLTRPRASQIYDLDYKQATRVVTVSNINLSGGAPSQVDGVNLSTNDRILVVAQDTPSQNGIYYVTTVGTGSSGTWARSQDTNSTGELDAGTIVMVTEGLIYADTQWKLITDNPIIIGTTPLVFTQNYSANSISGGTSNVTVYSNANVTISSAGTPNVLTISSTGIVVSGTGSTTGNIIGGNIVTGGEVSASGNVYGNNLIVSNIESVIGNITGGNILTSGQVSATGNITANYFLGNVACASGIFTTKIFNGTSEANIGTSGGNANITIGGTSNVVVVSADGTYTTGISSVTGNIIGGNIISNGILSSTGNLFSTGSIQTLANIYADNFVALENIDGGNLHLDGDISLAGNVNGNGNIQAYGNITGNYLLANIAYATGYTASKIYNGSSEANIGSLNGNANISINGVSNVAVFASDGEYITGNLNVTGNVIGTNILGNVDAFKTIVVSGQSNIIANTSNQEVTLATDPNSGLSWVTDAANNIITLTQVATESIFATGGDMGTVLDPVTSSEDLGSVIDVATIFYDLGSVVAASGLIYPTQLILPTYDVGSLPSANPAAQFVYLSTSSIGAMTAFSDGTNWRFTSSGNIVS